MMGLCIQVQYRFRDIGREERMLQPGCYSHPEIEGQSPEGHAAAGQCCPARPEASGESCSLEPNPNRVSQTAHFLPDLARASQRINLLRI